MLGGWRRGVAYVRMVSLDVVLGERGGWGVSCFTIFALYTEMCERRENSHPTRSSF